jgi:transglutaminase-like putative cysteine protease
MIKKAIRWSVTAMLLFIAVAATAQEIGRSILSLPDSLRRKANVVIREESFNIKVKSPGSAIVIWKGIYTILNEKGSMYGVNVEYYDNFHRLNDMTGVLYDAFGNKVKTVKKREIADEALGDFSLMTDARIKRMELYSKDYPYTVSFETEFEYNGIYSFPKFQPQQNSAIGVQNSSYTITVPKEYQLRYKLLNGALPPAISNTEGQTTYHWNYKNIPAKTYETLQPGLSELLPAVLVGPSIFEYGGYQGDFSSWQTYGKYYASLYQGRNELPENIKTKVHELTSNLPTRSAKVEALFKYLQQNTHYISIQLGIGGLQPFPASFVAEKKYGDCKALSNFMVAMLREAGIVAYNAVIYGGRQFPKVYDDFPRHYFNHVVACAPAPNDTIWLECTDQTVSAGYAGSFTGNRKALLITENGGQLVSTPQYKATDNLQQRTVQATIDENGHLQASLFTHYAGIQQEETHSLLFDKKKEQRDEALNKKFELPTYTVTEAKHEVITGKLPAINETLSISAAHYAGVSGKRLFVQPNIFTKEDKLLPDSNRQFPVAIDFGWLDTDSVVIQLPQGYEPESVPKTIELNTPFGQYSNRTVVKEGTVYFSRRHLAFTGTFPPSAYQDLVAFYDAIAKADRAKLVLVKKE